MDPEHEAKAIADLTTRLQARFFDVDPVLVEAAVLVSHSHVTGPIRDFVPLLVEHAARDRLTFTRQAGFDDRVGSDPRDRAHRCPGPTGSRRRLGRTSRGHRPRP